MRVRRFRRVSLMADDNILHDKDEGFVMLNCAIYLQRILDRYPVLDDAALKIIAWILGTGIGEAVEFLHAEMNSQERKRYEEDLIESIGNPEEIASAMIRILKGSKKSGSSNK